MIELLSIALKHSNIILNSIFIGAFILNLLFTIIFMEKTFCQFYLGLVTSLSFLAFIMFYLYLLLGRQIQRDQIFKIDKEDKKGLELIMSN